MPRWNHLCVCGCGDKALNEFFRIIEAHDKPHFRWRDIGGMLEFNDQERYRNPRAGLAKWYRKIVGFKEAMPITGALIFSHSNCAAKESNTEFDEARERRQQFPSDEEGEFNFCLNELKLLQSQAQELPPLGSEEFGWYFAMVNTEKAKHLTRHSTLHDAADCIIWLDGVVLEFFAKRLAREAAAHTHGHRHLLHHGAAEGHHYHSSLHQAMAHDPHHEPVVIS